MDLATPVVPTGATANPPRRWSAAWLACRWPVAAGLAAAAASAVGADAFEVAPIVTASGFVYLGAAALGRRTAAWPMFFLSVVVITIVNVIGLGPLWSTLAMLGVVGVLVGYGLNKRGLHPAREIPVQSAAMVVLAAASIIAVNVDVTWAGPLVAGGLIAHAGWDVHHHRAGRVVSPSLAEFCAVLDTTLAVAILVITFA